MNRIVHHALKVENLEKAAEFYEKVFGFQEVKTKETRDHN
jgi:predicted enzyme related to lactoylglutathione lyase